MIGTLLAAECFAAAARARAVSDQEDDDDKDASMKFPEMGDTWEPVVHASAGSSHKEVCDRMETSGDETGYLLNGWGDKEKGQAYFYCAKSRLSKTAQS